MGLEDEGRRRSISSARYDRRRGRINVILSNGLLLWFEPARLAEFEAADPAELGKVTITASGGLYWPALNLRFSLARVAMAALGLKPFAGCMAEAGRAGGRARTQAQADAARENGKKGGRPRTTEVKA
jgi:hypothetical protein